MNLDKDIGEYAFKICQTTEEYLDKIDDNNMIATLIMICKEIGEIKNTRPKDFRRKLKDLVDIAVK